MLPEVDEAILEALRDNLTNIPKKDIVIQKSTTPPKKTPSLYVWNKAFQASDTSIGGTGPESSESVQDEFDGDGRRTQFELSGRPLRSQLTLEYPPGRAREEGTHFKVDYTTGVVTLSTPAEKGRKIVVRFLSSKGAGEAKMLRLKLVYDLDVWASDPSEIGAVTNQVASAIILSRESLAAKGIQLRLVQGRDLPAQNGTPSEMYCKSLECVAEADMQVKIPYTRMEKIVMKKPEKQT
jgi:hypothetical protein